MAEPVVREAGQFRLVSGMVVRGPGEDLPGGELGGERASDPALVRGLVLGLAERRALVEVACLAGAFAAMAGALAFAALQRRG